MILKVKREGRLINSNFHRIIQNSFFAFDRFPPSLDRRSIRDPSNCTPLTKIRCEFRTFKSGSNMGEDLDIIVGFIIQRFNLVRCRCDEVSFFIMTQLNLRWLHIWRCVGPPDSPPVPRGVAGLKSGLIKFLVRCEGENKMGQRVKYCTGLHFARGRRRQARGGDPVCSSL